MQHMETYGNNTWKHIHENVIKTLMSGLCHSGDKVRMAVNWRQGREDRDW